MGETIKLLYDLLKIYSEDFYYDLLRLDFAMWVFVLTGAISLFTVFLYYYIINRPATAKLSIWFLFLVVNSLALSIVAYVIANNTIIDDYTSIGDAVPNYSTDLIYFSGFNFIVAALFYLIFSVLLKFRSSNSSHIPF